jgi:hypothetical protein
MLCWRCLPNGCTQRLKQATCKSRSLHSAILEYLSGYWNWQVRRVLSRLSSMREMHGTISALSVSQHRIYNRSCEVNRSRAHSCERSPTVSSCLSLMRVIDLSHSLLNIQVRYNEASKSGYQQRRQHHSSDKFGVSGSEVLSHGHCRRTIEYPLSAQ